MFDTLMYAKRLEAAGMTREQAEAQINVIAEMVVDGVATKQDIAILKQDTALEITQLRQEVALVRSDMGKEFAEVRTEFANVRLEIHKESVKNLKIMGGMFVASTTLTIGVLGLLLK